MMNKVQVASPQEKQELEVGLRQSTWDVYIASNTSGEEQKWDKRVSELETQAERAQYYYQYYNQYYDTHTAFLKLPPGGKEAKTNNLIELYEIAANAKAYAPTVQLQTNWSEIMDTLAASLKKRGLIITRVPHNAAPSTQAATPSVKSELETQSLHAQYHNQYYDAHKAFLKLPRGDKEAKVNAFIELYNIAANAKAYAPTAQLQTHWSEIMDTLAASLKKRGLIITQVSHDAAPSAEAPAPGVKKP
jgi:uncharacterized protein (DUF302 family)